MCAWTATGADKRGGAEAGRQADIREDVDGARRADGESDRKTGRRTGRRGGEGRGGEGDAVLSSIVQVGRL